MLSNKIQDDQSAYDAEAKVVPWLPTLAEIEEAKLRIRKDNLVRLREQQGPRPRPSARAERATAFFPRGSQ
jgi:hypothetical protein